MLHNFQEVHEALAKYIPAKQKLRTSYDLSQLRTLMGG